MDMYFKFVCSGITEPLYEEVQLPTTITNNSLHDVHFLQVVNNVAYGRQSFPTLSPSIKTSTIEYEHQNQDYEEIPPEGMQRSKDLINFQANEAYNTIKLV